MTADLVSRHTRVVEGVREVYHTRKRVVVEKQGRWLYAAGLTFNPKSLMACKANGYIGARCHLENLQSE